MNKKNYTALVGLFLLLCGTGLWAQKATTSHEFEVHNHYEESSYRTDNMRVSSESGFPLALFNPDYKLRPDQPQAMAMQYLEANQDLLGLSSEDLNNLYLHAVRESQAGTTVRLRQQINGVPVMTGEITINISPQNKVSYVMNNFRYGIKIDKFEAQKSTDFARQILVDRAQISEEAISQEKQSLEIFYNGGDARLVHRTNIISNEPIGEWEALIDAHSGEVLRLQDISFYYHDHREAILPAIPRSKTLAFMVTGTGPAFVPDPLSSANAAYNDTGFSDNGDADSPQLVNEIQTVPMLDITFDGTNYSLVGPWAEIVDVESPFNGLYEQTSSDWVFSRTMDGFEATNTYYHLDESMRYINIDLGLNIKPTDYPGGVKFDPHGLGGSDNSHYLGGSQTVTFGEGGVDDAEDSDVIHHELGHGLHDWVTNGGLSQVQGLSEGSGDYWAASYNRRLGLWSPTDDAYNWVFNWDGHNPFWSGRIVNFAGIYPAGLSGGIHNQGQLWSTAMMKVWDAIGSNLADKAFWEGLGMTNGGTNQDDAANAVYQAALNMNYSLNDLTGLFDALTSSGYTLPPLPLPIELASFTGFQEDKNIRLEWTTLSEVNNQYFEVERSLDGKNFTTIGKIASLGNSNSHQDYDFTDEQPFPNVNYYRLKQVDVDGKSDYSNILSFTFAQAGLAIFPNPVINQLTIESDLLESPDVIISVFDSVGKLRLTQNSGGDKQMNLDLSTFENGVYTLQVQLGNQVEVRRFSK